MVVRFFMVVCERLMVVLGVVFVDSMLMSVDECRVGGGFWGEERRRRGR